MLTLTQLGSEISTGIFLPSNLTDPVVQVVYDYKQDIRPALNTSAELAEVLHKGFLRRMKSATDKQHNGTD